jgi:UDP-sulfoquinovose synthase
VKIDHVPNPRVEKEEHYYNPIYTKLLNLGLNPHPLTDEVIKDMMLIIECYGELKTLNKDCIFKGYQWK